LSLKPSRFDPAGVIRALLAKNLLDFADLVLNLPLKVLGLALCFHVLVSNSVSDCLLDLRCIASVRRRTFLSTPCQTRRTLPPACFRFPSALSCVLDVLMAPDKEEKRVGTRSKEVCSRNMRPTRRSKKSCVSSSLKQKVAFFLFGVRSVFQCLCRRFFTRKGSFF
jgi:hypothetical protein